MYGRDKPHSNPKRAPALQDKAHKRTGRYLHSAVDLRNSVHFNAEDYAFAHRDHGEIRYLLDANVVRFFLNPFAEFRKIAFFDRRDRDSLQAVAAVTAEFLFSRELCGQWGAGPMISRWHAQELDGHANELSQLARAVLTGGREDKPDAEFDGLIDELISDANSLRNLRSSIDQVLSPLGGLGDRMANLALEAQQFVRMMRENLLSPLHLDKLATPEVLAPPKAEEESALIDWIELHRAEIAPAETNTRRNSAADAKTLIELLRLNEAARKATSRPLRYVLITADQALYNAAIDWLEHDAQGRIDFFPLRRIGQYIPILNIAEMPNRVEEHVLFRDVRNALDAFLSSVSVSGRSFPRPLPAWAQPSRADEDNPFHRQLSALAERMVEHANSDPRYLQTLDELTVLWTRLSRESVFLNASLLSRRISAFTSLAAFLEEADDIRAAVLQIMEETVAEVERAHIKFSVQHHFAAMIRELKEREVGVSVRRGMVVLETQFGEFIENRPLFQFLDQLVTEPDGLPLTRLLNRLSACTNYRAFFFSACVAFWASKWESAQFFIDRALNKFSNVRDGEDRSREHADLTYFAAVIRRYVTMDSNIPATKRVKALAATLPDLDEQLDLAIERDDPFARCRADLEIGLVNISVAYAHHVAKGRIDHAAAHGLTESALVRVGAAIRGLKVVLPEVRPEVGQQLMVEILICLTGCVLYKVFFDETTEIDSLAEWRSLSSYVRDLVDQTDNMVPEIYTLAPDLLEVIFENDPLQRARKRSAVVVRMQSFSHSAADRTRFDTEVLPLLVDRLRASPMHQLSGHR